VAEDLSFLVVWARKLCGVSQINAGLNFAWAWAQVAGGAAKKLNAFDWRALVQKYCDMDSGFKDSRTIERGAVSRRYVF